jgi:hypothetical protein
MRFRPRAILTRGRGFVRRRWPWLLAAVAVPVVLLIALDRFLDEPIRRQVERRMNERLQGYSVSLAAADFHLIGLSLDLLDLVVVQQAHPDPPVARIPRLSASVQWRALLRGRVVADFVIDHPVVVLDLEHFRQERKDPVPVHQRGWQEALQAAYPFKINELKIVEGELTYNDPQPSPPIELSRVNFVARNIRNIVSEKNVYPSTISLEAVVFDQGRLYLDGRADFLATPHPGVRAELRVERVGLDYVKPIAARYNFTLGAGTLDADGTLEYAPDGGTLVHFRQVSLAGARIDYVHSARTKAAEKQQVRKTAEAARQVSNEPGILLRIDRARVQGTFGFVNQAATPNYRVFLSETRLDVENLSNQRSEGTTVAKLVGKFMGSGPTTAEATFQPAKEGPDLDLLVRVENTDMRPMNDLLRAHGKLDVVRGVFSLYAEISVKKGRVTGYVKPLFRDLDVYDEHQDKHKGFFRKLYEGVVGGIARLLENKTPREEVATKAELAGTLDDPDASTWQIVVRLIQNAFFRAILPGLENELARLSR